MYPTKTLVRLLASVCCIAPFTASAESWPCFRGSNHDGISSEDDWSHAWSASGPTVHWKANVGTGYSSVVIQDGKLLTIGNEENVDTVYCLDASTGETVWSHDYSSPTDPNEFEGGPTSTPTFAGDEAFTLSRMGNLFCFNISDGKVKWSLNVATTANVRVPGWGFSGAPWVTDRHVVVNVADAGVGVDRKTGRIAWASEDKDAGYSSFVPVIVDGAPALVFGSARSYVCIRPDTGEQLWRQRWLTTFGCNAADPIIHGGEIFLSSGYNRGSALLSIAGGSPEVIWKHKDFQNQLQTSVKLGQFVYGANGDVDQGATLTCMKLASGEIMWSSPMRVGGILAAGDRLIVLSDSGLLSVLDASASGPNVLAQHQVLEAQCWTTPVLCDSFLYCRSSDGQLICLDLRATK